MSTAIGRQAEDAAAAYLKKQGFVILAQNWRTRWCEIDLIVKKRQTVHFVEVKYRAGTNFGGGLDYITPTKLRQMRFAADFWLTSQKHAGPCCLAAIELTGDPPGVTVWLDDLS